MPDFSNNDLTVAGVRLMAKAAAGAEIKYTRIIMGQGYLPVGQTPRNTTQVIDQFASLPIEKIKATYDDTFGYALIGGVFTNAGLAEGKYYRELGLCAEDPDDGEILYSYANAGDQAEYIPPGGGAAVIQKSIDVTTTIGTATNVTAVIASTLYARVEDLQQTAVDLTGLINAGDIKNHKDVLSIVDGRTTVAKAKQADNAMKADSAIEAAHAAAADTAGHANTATTADTAGHASTAAVAQNADMLKSVFAVINPAGRWVDKAVGLDVSAAKGAITLNSATYPSLLSFCRANIETAIAFAGQSASDGPRGTTVATLTYVWIPQGSDIATLVGTVLAFDPSHLNTGRMWVRYISSGAWAGDWNDVFGSLRLPATSEISGAVPTLFQRNTISGGSFNDLTLPGQYRINPTVSDGPSQFFPTNYCQLLVVNGAADTVSQLVFNYQNNNVAIRSGTTIVANANHFSNRAWSLLYSSSNPPPTKKYTTVVVGTSASKHTAGQVDYMCDGTDDQVEINAAIAAAASTYGEVLLLEGTYNLSAPISGNTFRVTLRGCGRSTRINRAYSESSSNFGMIRVYAAHCTITDMMLFGNGATYSNALNHGVAATTASHVNIQNMQISGCAGAGILVSGPLSPIITDNEILNCGTGIQAYDIHQGTVKGNIIDQCSTGISLTGVSASYPTQDNTIIGNVVNRGVVGIRLGANAGANSVAGNACRGNTTYDIRLESGATYNNVAENMVSAAVSNNGGSTNTVTSNRAATTTQVPLTVLSP